MDHVVLISTYELGRQPFGLASPAAWLKEAGADVVLQDLSVTALDAGSIRDALLVGVYLPMHTATRLAEPVLARVRALNPHAHICAYGLYAPMNADHLRAVGADTVLGGEFEEPLVGLYRELAAGRVHEDYRPAERPAVSLGRQQFLVPDRTELPGLDRYAGLLVGPGRIRTVGYTEASRGCKHLCRHCPIVPVYGGRFRVVQEAVVLEDIRRQVAVGAEHITFGDPDFFNAPAHSMKIVASLHEEFPELSYDVTIKVEHLRKHPGLVPALKRTGCVLVTTAIESVDDDVLQRLDKSHTAADLDYVLALLRDTGLALNPTFVAFTPWTTLQSYADFLQAILRMELVDLVSPVQYTIRLLIPLGSRILDLDDVRALVRGFDQTALAYPWSSPDPRVDRLHEDIVDIVKTDQKAGRDRREIFTHVWQAAFSLVDGGKMTGPDLSRLPVSADVPQLTEPWYCCAEPTDEQLTRL